MVWKCLSIELKVSCHSIKVKSKKESAQFDVIDIGYALLLQSNIISFGGGQINLYISSNTLGMIVLYEPNLFPQTHTPDTSFGLQILFQILSCRSRSCSFGCEIISLRLSELVKKKKKNKKKKKKKKREGKLQNMVEPTSFGWGQCANACLYI